MLQLLNKVYRNNRGEIYIFGIYMQFACKWDQTILCLENVFIFWKIFDDATGEASSTHQKKSFSNTWESQVWIFCSSYTPINIKWNKNLYIINVKVNLKILNWPLDCYWLQSKWKSDTRNFCSFVYLQSYNDRSKFLLIQTVQSSLYTSYLRMSNFCAKR